MFGCTCAFSEMARGKVISAGRPLSPSLLPQIGGAVYPPDLWRVNPSGSAEGDQGIA